MFNVVYEDKGRTAVYCGMNMSLEMAKVQLANFKRRYLNDDGTGRAFPNGKGFHTCRNPRIVRM